MQLVLFLDIQLCFIDMFIHVAIPNCFTLRGFMFYYMVGVATPCLILLLFFFRDTLAIAYFYFNNN